MVADHHRRLAAGDQVLDVLGLRLGEGAGTAVGRVGRSGLERAGVGLGRGRARASPEPAVVAVQVDADAEAAVAGAGGRAAAVGDVLSVDDPAVLALVGLSGRGQDRGAAAERVVGVELAEVGVLTVGAGQVEAVRVGDRYDDHAGLPEQPGDPGAPAVVLHQVEGELHRQLARGPLAGVVEAEEDERGLAAVGLAHSLADLDAERLVAVQRGPLERELPDQAGCFFASLVMSAL